MKEKTPSSEDIARTRRVAAKKIFVELVQAAVPVKSFATIVANIKDVIAAEYVAKIDRLESEIENAIDEKDEALKILVRQEQLIHRQAREISRLRSDYGD